MQSKGSTALDASCLLMPLMRCISPMDPRWLSTLKTVGDRLRDDSLIYRYSSGAAVDGLRGVEGTFNICSFWYVECLARAGDVKQARFLFEKMLGYANHVGLYSEELGPAERTSRQLPASLHPSLAHQRGILLGSSLVRPGWPQLSCSMSQNIQAR